MPFTAPIESIAFPSSASILSKTGSPRPAGTPSITHSIIAPALSPAFLISAIFSSIRAAASKSGARKAFSSITEQSIDLQEIPAASKVYAFIEKSEPNFASRTC